MGKTHSVNCNHFTGKKSKIKKYKKVFRPKRVHKNKYERYSKVVR